MKNERAFTEDWPNASESIGFVARECNETAECYLNKNNDNFFDDFDQFKKILGNFDINIDNENYQQFTNCNMRFGIMESDWSLYKNPHQMIDILNRIRKGSKSIKFETIILNRKPYVDSKIEFLPSHDVYYFFFELKEKKWYWRGIYTTQDLFEKYKD